MPDREAFLTKRLAERGSELENYRETIARLETILAIRDSMLNSSKRAWIDAAKAALNGDTQELRNRVADAEEMIDWNWSEDLAQSG